MVATVAGAQSTGRNLHREGRSVEVLLVKY